MYLFTRLSISVKISHNFRYKRIIITIIILIYLIYTYEFNLKFKKDYAKDISINTSNPMVIFSWI